MHSTQLFLHPGGFEQVGGVGRKFTSRRGVTFRSQASPHCLLQRSQQSLPLWRHFALFCMCLGPQSYRTQRRADLGGVSADLHEQGPHLKKWSTCLKHGWSIRFAPFCIFPPVSFARQRRCHAATTAGQLRHEHLLSPGRIRNVDDVGVYSQQESSKTLSFVQVASHAASWQLAQLACLGGSEFAIRCYLFRQESKRKLVLDPSFFGSFTDAQSPAAHDF